MSNPTIDRTKAEVIAKAMRFAKAVGDPSNLDITRQMMALYHACKRLDRLQRKRK